MNNTKLKQLILDTLKADERLWNKDKTELNQTLLLDLVENIDETVIDLLLQKKELREKFFVKIKDVYVFKTNDFRFFMEENKVDNSYTQYKNRIGLTDGKKFLKDTNDVVLNWPYKDCVLEGGQSTEEGLDTYFEYDETVTKAQEKQGLKAGTYNKKTAKRKEIFFNQILAYDEIDRLFDYKALVNWKRYTKDGEEEVKEIKRDENGIIKENLIIKGNNLLALHSLKKQFAGKIKLIYIDPPYNTGNDGFRYNDNFNESTWLTFMKNRLEVAKDLLRNDGSIIVQISDVEVSNLRILMDEVFGKNNFINKITVKTRSPSGFKTVNLGVFESAEYLLLYGKNKELCNYNTQYEETTYDPNYRYVILNPEDSAYNWKYESIDEIISKEMGFENVKEAKKSLGTKIFIDKKGDYALKNADRVFRFTEINIDAGKETLDVKEQSLKNPDMFYVVKRENHDDRIILHGNEITFYIKKVKEIDGELKPTNILTNIWTDIAWEGIANEGGVKLKKGKKPEKLLRRLIDMITSTGDIVLDYYLGSGTTCAVAHKMGRQYIGIEQLDYGENDSVIRLQNVINGDQSGISKSVNWQGGGDFIYFELAKWNETAKEKILECESLEELENFFDEMYERYFLNYNLKIKEFKEKVLQEENFRNLSLDEQKKIFVAMLDNNQMYVNKTEMADKKFGISEEDQNLTNQFYNSEE